MTNLSEKQLSFLWKKGVRLNQASYHYGTPSKKQDWNTAKDISVMDEVERAAKEKGSDQLEFGQALLTMMNAASKAMRPKSIAQDALRDDLKTWLRTGKVVGLGFEKPRTSVSIPIVIPRDHWFGRINWDKNSVDRDELAFVVVQIIPTHWLQDIHRIEPQVRISKSVGRPSLQTTLTAAIEQLLDSGDVDMEKTMTSHYPAILDLCLAMDPLLKKKTPPINNETIRKAFSPVFRDLKVTKKL